jgi:plastocyanin
MRRDREHRSNMAWRAIHFLSREDAVTLGTRILAAQALTVGILVTAAACGGGSPTSPGGGGGSVVVASTGTVGTVGATITIGTNSTVSPSQVTIGVGQSVTFVNNDTRSHDMSSDPHPTHTACPSIGNVSLLQPGQSKTTFGFASTGSCGFHDHNLPESSGLTGRIVIQ